MTMISAEDTLGPLLVGTDPLPENLQGLWWQQRQGTGGALMSFGGPTNDAGACSRGSDDDDDDGSDGSAKSDLSNR